MTNQVAVNSPQLNAAVPYYGSAPKEEDVPKIKASMLLHYAGDDERIIPCRTTVEDDATRGNGIAACEVERQRIRNDFDGDGPPRQNELGETGIDVELRAGRRGRGWWRRLSAAPSAAGRQQGRQGNGKGRQPH